MPESAVGNDALDFSQGKERRIDAVTTQHRNNKKHPWESVIWYDYIRL
jgi:hypothetical protein